MHLLLNFVVDAWSVSLATYYWHVIDKKNGTATKNFLTLYLYKRKPGQLQ